MPAQFRRLLPLLVVLVIGATACALGFWGMRQLEWRMAKAEFELSSQSRASAVRREIDTSLAALSTLRGFTELSAEVTQKGFEQFSARLLAVYPSIRALEWIPRVPASQRAAFEAQLRLEGSSNTEITDGTPPSNLRRAAARDEYFPVEHIYPPTESTRSLMGYDVSTSTTFANAMKRARETGEPIAADRFKLLERTADGFGVPVFLPVFRTGQEIRGYVLGIFQLADILERALKYVDPRGINIEVFDDSAPVGGRNLFFYQSRRARHGETTTPDGRSIDANALVYSYVSEVAGRRWRFVCTPSQEFLENIATWKPWAVLAAGVLLTLLAGAYFLLNLVHSGRNERLLEALSKANEQLSKEIAERIKAEGDLAAARDQALDGSRLASQFLAKAGQQIRTPMDGIIEMTGLLLNTPLTAEQRDYAEGVKRLGDAVVSVIDDIPDLSKSESSKQG